MSNLIRTAAEWGAYLEKLQRADYFFLDCETTGLEAWGADMIVGVAIKGPGLPSVYAPFRHLEGNIPIECLHDLAPLLRSKLFINHHDAFDLRFLLKEGLPLPERLEDTMIAAHLLDCNQSAALKTLGAKYLDPNAAKAEEELEALLDLHKLKGKQEMYKLPPEMVANYACQDVDLVEALRNWQRPHLERWGLYSLYLERCAYQQLLLKAEHRGFLLDRKLTQEYSDEAVTQKAELTKEICDLAGEEVNPGSPKQMAKLLGVASTAEKIIRKLGDGDRRAAALLDFRGWAKLRGTYYEAFLRGIDESSVLRASFKINGTVAGRLSMEKPNLQAIPQYSEMYKVKDVFVARPGYTLIEADYSALELRLAAHFTGEPNLVQAFEKNESPHDSVAAKMGIDRHTAKTLNFSILYGAGPSRISEQFGLSKSAAGALLASYWKANPLIYRWKEAVQEKARQTGYVRLWSGHIRRYMPEVAYTPGHKGKAQPHTAPNNVIQGSGAEIIRRATQRLDKRLAGSGANLLLQVHDSLVYEVPEAQLANVSYCVREVMEFNPEFNVPLLVDIKAGCSWGKMKKYAPNS